MCELFGFCGSQPVSLNRELEAFYAHADEHPNGWGLALLDQDCFSIEKEPANARKSHYLKERLREPISAGTALAHIRFATIGSEAWRNCHPFTGLDVSGRRWTLIHNGTIFDYPGMNSYVRLQKGDTDSERILLYLMDQVAEETRLLGHPLTAEERFRLLDRIVIALSPGNKVNLLIYDEELLYAHTNYAGSLYRREDERGVCLSTRPLTFEQWTPVPFTTLIAYRQGKQVFSGTKHNQEYFVDEEKMKMLFLAYSSL